MIMMIMMIIQITYTRLAVDYRVGIWYDRRSFAYCTRRWCGDGCDCCGKEAQQKSQGRWGSNYGFFHSWHYCKFIQFKYYVWRHDVFSYSQWWTCFKKGWMPCNNRRDLSVTRIIQSFATKLDEIRIEKMVALAWCEWLHPRFQFWSCTKIRPRLPTSSISFLRHVKETEQEELAPKWVLWTFFILNPF